MEGWWTQLKPGFVPGIPSSQRKGVGKDLRGLGLCMVLLCHTGGGYMIDGR